MKKILLFFFFGVATAAIAQDNNPILNSSNASLSITNFRGSGTTNNLGGTPLGTVDGTATGELGQKVIVIGSSGIAATVSTAGAAHVAGTSVTASTTPGTLVIARPTRRSAVARNTDAAITVTVGPVGGVVMPLKPGESIPITSVVLWQVTAASGSPVLVVLDEYD